MCIPKEQCSFIEMDVWDTIGVLSKDVDGSGDWDKENEILNHL